MSKGFTLIELLVVITIIVVLLSLLAPALDRAVYQAQLVQCGAGQLKTLAGALNVYAVNNRRHYPDRGFAGRGYRETGGLGLSATNVYNPLRRYDVRPPLRPLVSINQVLQCPLAGRIELDDPSPETPDENDDILLEASYTMWWGWQYKHQSKSFAGMFKLGDTFEYENLGVGNRNTVIPFRILAGDIDLAYPGAPAASHPDREPETMALSTLEPGVFIGRFSSAWWRGADPNRGLLDNNFVFTDGSVARYSEVVSINRPAARRHPQMALAPITYDSLSDRGNNVDKFQIPKN